MVPSSVLTRDFSPTERWYAAGYLEGALTYNLMWDYYMNLYATDVGIYSNKELVRLTNFCIDRLL